MTNNEESESRSIDVSIPAGEWAAASSLTQLLTDDERHPTGLVELRTVDGRRRWTATDRDRVGQFDGGSDGNDYAVLLSPALMRAADAATSNDEGADLRINLVDGAPYSASVVGTRSITTVLIPDLPFPDVDAMFDLEPEEIAARAMVNAHELYKLVWSRNSRITAVDDSELHLEKPDYWFGILDGLVHSEIDWYEVGQTKSSIVAEEVHGDAGAPTNPNQLQSVIAFFMVEDRIEILIPMRDDQPLRFIGDERRTALMPLFRKSHYVRRRTETAIEEAAGPLSLSRDSDGDYPLSRDGLDIWGRLTDDGAPQLLQIFAVVLHDVDPTPELLTELNDLNSNLGFARIFAVQGQVLAEVDLVAETVDAPEVATAINRITDVAVRLAPMLQTMFGGSAAPNPRLSRIDRLAEASVDAELEPGRLVALAGPDARPEWTFDGPVHVVSGWNPQGSRRDEVGNNEINALIAADIVRSGGALARSTTSFTDGSAESSLLIWHMTRAEVLDLGRRANRDAVLELDAEALRVLSCTDETIVERPRMVRDSPNSEM